MLYFHRKMLLHTILQLAMMPRMDAFGLQTSRIKVLISLRLQIFHRRGPYKINCPRQSSQIHKVPRDVLVHYWYLCCRIYPLLPLPWSRISLRNAAGSMIKSMRVLACKGV